MLRALRRFFAFIVLVAFVQTASAVPLMALFDQKPQESATDDLPERVDVLERQLEAMRAEQLAAQLEKLAQQLAELRGQLEVQQHSLHALKTQQAAYYQDLNQRLQLTQQKRPAATHGPDEIAYRTAFQTLQKKNIPLATQQFHTFLQHYPHSSYVPNAHYWLGEIDLLAHKPLEASKHFKLITEKYPKSQKNHDAAVKLKIAYGMISPSK